MSDRSMTASEGTLVPSSRLGAYAAAAAATLAASGAASGAIQYTDPADINVGQGSSFLVDLNSDSVSDLRLKNYVFAGGNYMGATVNFAPGRLVSFIAGPNNFSYVRNLAPGTLIDGNSPFPSFFGSMAYGPINPNAQFNLVTDGLIGLSFPAGSDLFFGWVRVDVNRNAGTLVIKDWAFEDAAGNGIPAGVIPEPASLGLLALGAAGLAAYRGKRR